MVSHTMLETTAWFPKIVKILPRIKLFIIDDTYGKEVLKNTKILYRLKFM